MPRGHEEIEIKKRALAGVIARKGKSRSFADREGDASRAESVESLARSIDNCEGQGGCGKGSGAQGGHLERSQLESPSRCQPQGNS